MHKRSSCTLWSQMFSVFVRCFMSSHKRRLGWRDGLVTRSVLCSAEDPSFVSISHVGELVTAVTLAPGHTEPFWPYGHPHSCAHHTVHTIKDKQHLTNSTEAESLHTHRMTRKDNWWVQGVYRSIRTWTSFSH